MRVTGGEYRGRKLKAPAGLDVRPTTDKIRQAIFNILAHETPGARVLDLFCGCGSLGIEALSRGAESVVFVDEANKSLQSLRGNLAELSLEAEILALDWKVALRRLSESGRTFDLIFADPPYGRIAAKTIVAGLTPNGAASLLAPDGIFIMESEIEAQPAGELRVLKERKFGQTKITFYTHKNNETE